MMKRVKKEKEKFLIILQTTAMHKMKQNEIMTEVSRNRCCVKLRLWLQDKFLSALEGIFMFYLSRLQAVYHIVRAVIKNACAVRLFSAPLHRQVAYFNWIVDSEILYNYRVSMADWLCGKMSAVDGV
jgi:hypothetical protein